MIRSMTSKENVEPTPAVSLRPAIAGLPAYVPGASGEDEKIFKLSSNEVPHPPAPAVVEAITKHASGVNRYPHMYGDDLCEELSTHLGLPAEQILVGNGSVSLLELILKAAAGTGDEVVYSWRSFEAYPILVQVTGATSIQVPNTPTGGHDLEAMARAVTDRTKVVMVCTPNNPTSVAATHTEIKNFLHALPADVLVLLDEAYVHFDHSETRVDSLDLLREFPNLIALRTFSKAYGLAGLRAGYALGAAELISSIRSASTPFGLNALAATAATAALNSPEYTHNVVQQVCAERTRVVDELRKQGWEVGDPQGNFYWLPISDPYEFAAEALRRGFTARPFPEGVRITIGEVEANDLALELTGQWAQK